MQCHYIRSMCLTTLTTFKIADALATGFPQDMFYSHRKSNKHVPSAKESLDKLKAYCEAEEFKGWILLMVKQWGIQNIPIVRKMHCAVDLDSDVQEKSHQSAEVIIHKKRLHPKGLGLFLNGYCNLTGLIRRRNTSTSFGCWRTE